MFYQAKAFNGDVSKWDVSKVQSMYATFGGTALFNGDLSQPQQLTLGTMPDMQLGGETHHQNRAIDSYRTQQWIASP